MSWPFLSELESPDRPFIPKIYEEVTKQKKGSRCFYDVFVKKICCERKYQSKWIDCLQISEDINLKKLELVIFKCTNDVNLRWFQYRFIHRILATNSFLKKIRVKDDYYCTFCKFEEETLIHLYYECKYIQRIWSLLEDWIYEKTGILMNYTKIELLFGKFGKQFITLNLIVFLVKYYIYKQRLCGNNLHFENIQHFINDNYYVEKQIYFSKVKFENFYKRWNRLLGLFT